MILRLTQSSCAGAGTELGKKTILGNLVFTKLYLLKILDLWKNEQCSVKSNLLKKCERSSLPHLQLGNFSQGGIFQGNQGARFPRNLQVHTKSLLQFTLFCCEFDIKVFPYFLAKEGILSISHNLQEIFSCQRKYNLGTGRYLLSQE